MSLDRAILSGKEYHKDYYDSRLIDKTCRAHGSCDWCRMTRTYKNRKAEFNSKEAIKTFLREDAMGLLD